MGPLHTDLSNQQFNNLLVIERDFSKKGKNSYWICKCLLCDSLTTISRPSLRSGDNKDCGCQKSNKISQANTTHGMSKSPTWKSWFTMRRRIRQGVAHHPTYERMYIDPRWEDFNNFLDDMGERPEGCTIDRIDNTKGYYKENCRWATHKEQCQNKSNNITLTFNGKSQCLKEWSRELNIDYSCLYSRFKSNWTTEKILTTPSGSKKNPPKGQKRKG